MSTTYRFPMDFVERVIELYPDDLELHKALETGDFNVVEKHLSESSHDFSFEKLARIFDRVEELIRQGDHDGLTGEILLLKQRHHLYGWWCSLVDD